MRTLATAFAACLLIVQSAVWAQSLGLMASPNPLTITVPTGSSPTSQIVNITVNGTLATIASVSTSTTTGQNWLLAFISSPGVVTTTVNPAGLSGSFSGTVFVNTTVGPIAVSVNLNVGVNPPATPAPPSLVLILTGLAAAGLYQMRRKLVRPM
jgi:hypothetical protein